MRLWSCVSCHARSLRFERLVAPACGARDSFGRRTALGAAARGRRAGSSLGSRRGPCGDLALPSSLSGCALARWHLPASRSMAYPYESARCAAQMSTSTAVTHAARHAASDCYDALDALRCVLVALLAARGIGTRRPEQLQAAETLAAPLGEAAATGTPAVDLNWRPTQRCSEPRWRLWRCRRSR